MIKALHTSAAVFGGLAMLVALLGGMLACYCSCCGQELNEPEFPNKVSLRYRRGGGTPEKYVTGMCGHIDPHFLTVCH